MVRKNKKQLKKQIKDTQTKKLEQEIENNRNQKLKKKEQDQEIKKAVNNTRACELKVKQTKYNNKQAHKIHRKHLRIKRQRESLILHPIIARIRFYLIQTLKAMLLLTIFGLPTVMDMSMIETVVENPVMTSQILWASQEQLQYLHIFSAGAMLIGLYRICKLNWSFNTYRIELNEQYFTLKQKDVQDE